MLASVPDPTLVSGIEIRHLYILLSPSQSHSQTLTSRLGMRLDLVLSYLCGCVGEMENSQLAVVVHGLYISLYGMLWTMNSNVPV